LSVFRAIAKKQTVNERPKAAGFDCHRVLPVSYNELHRLLRPKSKTVT
jgi:hypothetical protein